MTKHPTKIRNGQRTAYVNNLCAMVIMLIVVGHFVDLCTEGSGMSKSLFLFIYSFHMPLLIFLAGSLSRETVGDRKRVLWGAARMFLLYIGVKVVIWLVRLVLGGSPKFSLLSDSGMPWLFFTLGIYLIVAYLVRNINKKFLIILTIVLALLCGYNTSIGDYLIASRTFVFLPFFLLGQTFDMDEVSSRTEGNGKRAAGVAVLVLALLAMVVFRKQLYVLRPMFTGRSSYDSLGKGAQVKWAYRLAAYAVSVTMSWAMLAVTPRVALGRWISRLGERFLFVYFWHRPLLYVLTGIGTFEFLEKCFGWRVGRIAWLMLGCLCVCLLANPWLERLSVFISAAAHRLSDWIFRKFNRSEKWRLTFEYILLYTICFLAVFLIAYSPFLAEGKTFIWKSDGRRQDYPFALYVGNTIRQIIRSVFQGRFEIPLFGLSMNSGDDIIGFLGSNGATDPLLLLYAFVPVNCAEYLYAFLTIFRLYLAGLSFAYLCFYFGKRKYQTLIGSMVYCFCGYAVFCTMRHPYFVNPMVILPMLIVGLDKILRKERPYLFIFAVCYAALCGFYHVYMMSILLGIYGLVRFFDPDIRGGVSHFCRVVLRAVGGYCLGIGMAAIVFFPMVMEFLNAGRNGFHNYNGSYAWSYYYTRLMRFIAPPGSWTDMSFAAIVLLALVLLLCSKGRRTLKTLALAALAIWLTSIGGLIMNGFQYSSNRWTFGLSLVMAYVAVEMVPELVNMTFRQRLLASGTVCAYLLASFVNGDMRKLKYVSVGAVFLTLTMVVLVFPGWACASSREGLFSVGEKQGGAGVWRMRFCLLLVIVNVGINGLYKYASDQGNYVSEFKQIGYETNRIAESPEQEMAEYLEDRPDGRADGSSFTIGTSIPLGLPAMLFFSATVSGDTLQYWNEIENCGNEQTFNIFSTDQRAIATTLLSTKYYIEDEKRTQYVPYGYSLIGTTDSGRKIYQNDYALPWGYTYDHVMSHQDLESLNGVRKQEAMVQAVALDDWPLEIANGQITYNSIQLPYETSFKNCEWKDGKIVVSKANAEVTLNFSAPAGSECYVRLAGFDINDSGLTSFTLKASSGGTTKTSLAESHLYSWYYGRENYLFNLGYSDEERTSCTITFPSKGTFKLADIELYALPMENYPEHIEALRAEPLENIEMTTNHISGTVDLSKDKILCMSIPYSKGWTAKVDGEKAEILRGNYMFMCVPLTAGHHEIEFSYCSPGLKLGVIVSIISLCVVIGVAVHDRRGRLRAETSRQAEG